MMRRLVWVLGLALAPSLAAQQDSTGPGDGPERERLLQQVERRFGEVVRQQLGLSDDQAGRLRATEERFRARRRDILRRQLALRFGLQGQMRPGQSADADSVRKLMDEIQANRAELFQLEQQQDREMTGYLTAVQRAQYQMLRERLLRRLAEVRRERVRSGVARPREGRRRRP
jgi:predicted phage gp36 major capsid-like protein